MAGITRDAMAMWREAGAAGVGIGSALYKPGRRRSELRQPGDGLSSLTFACGPRFTLIAFVFR